MGSQKGAFFSFLSFSPIFPANISLEAPEKAIIKLLDHEAATGGAGH
jgi:hypothetical protein